MFLSSVPMMEKIHQLWPQLKLNEKDLTQENNKDTIIWDSSCKMV